MNINEEIDPDEILRDIADAAEREGRIPEDGLREVNFGSRADEDENFEEMSDDLKDF